METGNQNSKYKIGEAWILQKEMASEDDTDEVKWYSTYRKWL